MRAACTSGTEILDSMMYRSSSDITWWPIHGGNDDAEEEEEEEEEEDAEVSGVVMVH